jgi:integrase/recombinase XerC
MSTDTNDSTNPIESNDATPAPTKRSTKRRRARRLNGTGSVLQRRPGACFTLQYSDATGRRKTERTNTTDRALAEQLLAQRRNEAERIRFGILDPRGIHHADQNRTPIQEHLDAYIAQCRLRGDSKRHVDQKKRHLDDVLTFTKATQLSTLRIDDVNRYLLSIDAAKRGARTRNIIRADVVAFGTWCVKSDRLPHNPWTNVVRADEVMDRRRERRAFTTDELAKFLDVSKARSPDRWLAYFVAVNTGLRRSELRGLRWADVDMDANEPTVTVRASVSKSRTQAELPLLPDVATALRAAKPTAALPSARVFRVVPSIRRFHDDLKAAKVNNDGLDGRKLDFHALRATFATRLARAGVAPQIAKRLLRHSDVKVTMQHYTKLELADLSSAVAKLAPIVASSSDAQAQSATGTDGVLQCKLQSQGESGRSETTGCVVEFETSDSRNAESPAQNDSMRGIAMSSVERLTGIEPATFSLPGFREIEFEVSAMEFLQTKAAWCVSKHIAAVERRFVSGEHVLARGNGRGSTTA